MYQLIRKILTIFKENLTHIINDSNGLYCMLFIQNIVGYIIDSRDQNSSEEESPENYELQEVLDLIWQEMHIITSKLTQT